MVPGRSDVHGGVQGRPGGCGEVKTTGGSNRRENL